MRSQSVCRVALVVACSVVFVSGLMDSTIGQGGDGNPHGWDRIRRCDHAQYTPKCGPCEGRGGIVTSDSSDGFVGPFCKDVTPSGFEVSSAVRPKWGGAVTIKRSYEILIGKKLDPFCFKVFPGNSSAGENCYKPQTGTIIAGVGTTRKALYEEMNQENFGKNVTAKIVHEGQTMWIVNDLLFGIHQCICTQPREGGVGDAVYPLQYNWTDNLIFVAVENLTVEYGVGNRILNHWGFGPHHVWTDITDGNIVRAWQPYNGLQIFDPSEGIEYSADVSQIMETPPTLCKKGGATMRIKCDDNGNYDAKGVFMSQTDLERARTRRPRSVYRGANHTDMSLVLNRWLKRKDVNSKECGDWSVSELREFIRLMHNLRHSDFDEIYSANSDNRAINKDVESRWSALDSVHDIEPCADELKDVHRDGLCHEAVMLYVHHLTGEVQSSIALRKTPVPLLSYKGHSPSEHPSTLSADMTFKLYEEQVTCASCHSDYSVSSAVVV